MTERFRFPVIFSAIFLALFLISCGSGVEGDADEDTTYDISKLAVTSVAPSGGVLKAGHAGQVNVSLASTESKPVNKVPVSIVFMASGDGEVEEYYSGTYLIDVVQPGTNGYNLTINVPQIDGAFGEYTILAFLYEKLIAKTSKGANLSDDEEEESEFDIEDDGTGSSGTVEIDPSLQNLPDVRISDVILSEDVLVINTGSIKGENNPLEFSIKFKTDALAADVTDAKAKFFISHIDGSKRFQVKVKNEEGNAVDEISLPTIIKYDPAVERELEVVVPIEAISSIVTWIKEQSASRYPFIFETEITSAAEPDEFKENNSAIANVWIVPDDSLVPQITSERKIGVAIRKWFGNKWIGGGFEFSTWTGINRDKLYTEHWAALPASILTKGFNFFDAELYARGYFKGQSTDGKTPGIGYRVRKVKPTLSMKTLYSYYNEAYGEFKSPGIRPGQEILDQLCYNDAAANGTISFSAFIGDIAPKYNSDYSFYMKESWGGTVMIGPVPISFAIGIDGWAGAGIFAVYQQVNVAAGIVPYAGLGCFVEAGVGPSWITFVGMGGTLNILEINVNNLLWTSWEDYLDENNYLYKKFALNEYSGFVTKLFSGNIYGFVRYPWPVFKKKWGVPYFAGFQIKEERHYFWNSGWMWRQEWPLLKKKEYIVLIPLD
jgi:hypothetical protein